MNFAMSIVLSDTGVHHARHVVFETNRVAREQQRSPLRPYRGSFLGSPNAGSTLVSKRAISLISPPARVRTINPIAWKTVPPGSQMYIPNAGWPFALVGIIRYLRRPCKLTAVKNCAASLRP